MDICSYKISYVPFTDIFIDVDKLESNDSTDEKEKKKTKQKITNERPIKQGKKIMSNVTLDTLLLLSWFLFFIFLKHTQIVCHF